MGILKSIIDVVAPVEDDGDEVVEIERDVAGRAGYEKAKSKTVADSKAKMVLFEPRSFEEAQEIGRHLTEGRACIVNFHRLNKDYAQRTIDFLSGVTFALRGTIDRVDANVYLCSPNSLGVAGSIDLFSAE